MDNNEFGLNLLSGAAIGSNLFLHPADVLNLNLDLQADTVFSLGLIEHFDVAGTRHAIDSHLQRNQAWRHRGDYVSHSDAALPVEPGHFGTGWKMDLSRRTSLRTPEVRSAIDGAGRLLYSRLIWQTPYRERLW